MERPLILVIDDNLTTRKVVECHLAQAGYRVALAAEAQSGLARARELRPSLILLDHQLPGTTGDVVCRQLLDSPATASIPVVISSAMRNRAFAAYSEFSNVVDQIPKPFTPELLKSGVANALRIGADVVRAQQSGGSLPEQVDDTEASLQGHTSAFPLRAVLDFLNNNSVSGRLEVESGDQRYQFWTAGGRIQAVASTSASLASLEGYLPEDLANLAPLLAVTLGEQQDEQISSLVRLLERSLSDPKRLRDLLRFQSSVLTHAALTAPAGRFAFEPGRASPSMFQAFPLQSSLVALASAGAGYAEVPEEASSWAGMVFSRLSPRGGNADRAGLTAVELKATMLFDGTRELSAVAEEAGLKLRDAGKLARGLELAGLAQRRAKKAQGSILVLESDPEAARVIQRILGTDGLGYQLKLVRDAVGAQLLLRRGGFDLVFVELDGASQERAYRACRTDSPERTRFIAIANVQDEDDLERLDHLGLDGVIHRPISENDLTALVAHLMEPGHVAVAS
jgi:CheY-like chemotaxis protein